MRPTHPIVKTVLAAVVFACLLFATSCVTSADGVRSSSMVMAVTLTDGKGHATGQLRSDLNTSLVAGTGAIEGVIFEKPSQTLPNGIVLYGPIIGEVGKMHVWDRARHVSITLNVGEPLPAFCAVLYRPGEAEALGLTFAPAVAPPASP